MRIPRFLAAIAGASALTIALSGTVAADTVVGTHGHYLITDSQTAPGAGCAYFHASSGNWVIYRIVTRAPAVWWPLTSSSTHGLVGWRVVISQSTNGTTWTMLERSPIQFATAFKDVPAFNSADKAPFTPISVSVPGPLLNVNDKLKVTVRIFWFADNTVIGSVSHTVTFYRIRLGTVATFVDSPYCLQHFNGG